jgi:UDP-N-acetylmuramyl pentapeptide phosphotransferase/UDP-N-acetylglucosamine-1-phosphate transferase
VWFGGVRITDFHPVLDYGGISPVLSIIVTVFLFVLLINGFNLIDGIDGLASGLGIVISAFYGSWFIYSGHYTAGVISLSIAGALIAFFRYNIFSRNNKLFLGDTGSMITGYVVAFLTVQFIEYNLNAPAGIGMKSAPAVAYGLLIVPLIDMLKVFILRSWNGKSPFKADRNHIHHTLLSLGCSHLEATLILSGMTILFLALAMVLRDLGALWLMILLTAAAFLVISVPWMILKTRIRKAKLIQNE